MVNSGTLGDKYFNGVNHADQCAIHDDAAGEQDDEKII
jgi:hypothetical protein